MQITKIYKAYMSWIVNLGQSMHYIQAYKIFNNKSAEDISIVAYIICLILLIHWLIYGIIEKDKIIIIAESLGSVGVLLILVGTIYYG